MNRAARHRAAAFAGCAAAALALAPVRTSLAQMPEHSYDLGVGRWGYGIIGYEPSIPTGDASDFVSSNMSWIGFTFAGYRMVRPQVSLGFESGWNVFHDRSGGTTQLNYGAVTGEQYRHILQIPLLASARYYTGRPGSASRVRPFVGLGVGTYWSRQLLDIGLNEFRADAWHFGLAPEAGVLVLGGSTSMLQLRVKYNYPFSSGDYLGGGGRSFNNFAFGIGAGVHY